MKAFLIGLGGAGCRIAHQFFEEDHLEGVLIDTDLSSLGYLKHRYRIPAGEGVLGGEGTQRDLELGLEVIGADRFSIVEKISRVKGDVDCFFIISALGGGTGGAAGPILEEMRKNFIEPLYHIAVLPSKEDLPTVQANASKALEALVPHCNAYFPVHMDSFKTSTRVKGNLKSINNRIYRYFTRVFSIGEFKGKGDIGENVVDFSDFVKTLKGLSTVGLEKVNLKEDPTADKPEAVIDLTRRAVNLTTIPIELKDVSRSLVTILGDRNVIDFLGSIPARLWVEKHIGKKEVRGGDMPLNERGVVESLVILSDIRKSREINILFQRSQTLSKKDAQLMNLQELVESLESLRAQSMEMSRTIEQTLDKLKKG